MRQLLLISLLIIPLVGFGQTKEKLKRKYFGKYKGMIPSYVVNTGYETAEVGETPIYVDLSKSQVSMTIGKRNLIGEYEVMFKSKKYYLLDVKIKGQLASERILVYVRGKRISRDGMYPQPVAELRKFK